jgi:hypothetical protein
MFNIVDICAARVARRRLVARRRMIKLVALTRAVQQHQDDLIAQRKALWRLRAALEEPLIRVSRGERDAT